MIFLQLFWEFFKIGLFAVGGGLASLPFLYDIAARYPWFTSEQITDMIAIAESTPGPLGANMATFAGFNAAGILGGVIATLSLIVPSVIITLIISKVMSRFSQSVLVENAFYGLRPVVAGLIAAVCVTLLEIAVFNAGGSGLLGMVNWKAALLFVVLLVLVFKLNKHPVLYIAAAAVIGIIFRF